MKRAITLILATATLSAAVPAIAHAQDNNQLHRANQANIEQAVRNGRMSPATADTLMGEHRYIGHVRSEYLHSGNGINDRENADLRRRLTALSAKIDRYDGPGRGAALPPRTDREDILRSIDRGLSNGRLTTREAQHLRAEYNDVAQLERRYAANGLSQAERREVESRLDALAQHVRVASQDAQVSARRMNGYQR